MRGRLSALGALVLIVSMDAGVAAEKPYVGRWDCGVAIFTFTSRTYDNGDGPQRAKVEFDGAGLYRFEFPDGYAFVVQPHKGGRSMTWQSLESGDTFECRRLREETGKRKPAVRAGSVASVV